MAEQDTATLTSNHFSHFKYSEIYHILRYFKISFFRQYSTHMEQFLYPEMKTPHRGVQGHTRASFTVDRSAHILSLPITRKSGKHPSLLTSLPTRVYIPQAALPTSKNGGYVMDILQSFLSISDPPKPTFSEIFHSAQELRSALDTKSYLLDHYLSLFFQMVSQLDFIVLQDEAQTAMGEMHHLFSDTNGKTSPKISAIMEQFPGQEASTKQNLCLTSTADFIFEQSLLDLLAEKNSLFPWTP
ncbi:hypothetical protein [Anaerotignum lactatifermentans]|uniref:hypothetical protein n=1 Tax=Anaerotignum lactatifermentans TaxID=160404 RepID=UPI002670D663|nr:hypothetical protein [Anaerotignum lactatifermentans]